MALVMTLRRGEAFMAGDVKITLQEIVSADTFVLRSPAEVVEVGPDAWIDLIPGVQVRSTIPADPTRRTSTIRVEVNAPGIYVHRVKEYS